MPFISVNVFFEKCIEASLHFGEGWMLEEEI